MKVNKGISTWRIWGLYIQCLKELNLAKSNIMDTIPPHKKGILVPATNYIHAT